MIIDEKKLYVFLDDRTQHELRFSHGRRSSILFKSAFDAETDFLYLLEGYNGGDPHATNGSASYAGVYSHVRRQYFDLPCILRERSDEERRLAALLTEFSEAVSSRIAEMVHDAPVPVTDEAEEIRSEREYVLKYLVPQDARECFFGVTKKLHYRPLYSIPEPSTADVAAILNHFENAVNAHAKAFIRAKAREINEKIWRIEQIREEVARLEATPGEHHSRRAIMKSVADRSMKTVTMEIQKDGDFAIVKIEASTLRSMENSYYSPWCMDPASRMKLAARFGQASDVYPDDVVKITYKRKVLYEKKAETSRS